ncbi:MAG: 50S ribosomal protein L31 [Coriobacteriia bacterium]|nr:50S ribosomal protein L31 [Coriobacteriia bacterium]
MKEELHPGYEVTVYECSCGNTFESMSTKGGKLHIELCDKCHPFYTGTQKLIDTGGRVQRFSDKFGAAASATLKKDAAAKEARRKAAEELEIVKRAQREEKAAAKAAKASEFAHLSESARAEAEVEAAVEVGDEAAAEAAQDSAGVVEGGSDVIDDATVAGIDAAEAEQEDEVQAEDAAAVEAADANIDA